MKKPLSLSLLVTFLLVPIVNYYVTLVDSGNRFEDDPEVLLEPAGYAFSIWAIIFAGMIFWSYKVWKTLDEKNPVVRKAIIAAISAGWASITFAPISLLNNSHLTVINLLWHLVSLIFLFVYCRQLKVSRSTLFSRWWYIGPDMYLGWICAATAVSISLWLRYMGVSFDYDVEVSITVGVLLVLGFIAARLIENRGSIAALTIIWALIGLIVARQDNNKIMFASILISVFILIKILWHTRKDEQVI